MAETFSGPLSDTDLQYACLVCRFFTFSMHIWAIWSCLSCIWMINCSTVSCLSSRPLWDHILSGFPNRWGCEEGRGVLLCLLLYDRELCISCRKIHLRWNLRLCFCNWGVNVQVSRESISVLRVAVKKRFSIFIYIRMHMQTNILYTYSKFQFPTLVRAFPWRLHVIPAFGMGFLRVLRLPPTTKNMCPPWGLWMGGGVALGRASDYNFTWPTADIRLYLNVDACLHFLWC